MSKGRPRSNMVGTIVYNGFWNPLLSAAYMRFKILVDRKRM